jgi:hypothetical protein
MARSPEHRASHPKVIDGVRLRAERDLARLATAQRYVHNDQRTPMNPPADPYALPAKGNRD